MITEDAVLNLFPHGYRELVSVLPSFPGLNLSSGSGSGSGTGSRFRIPAFPYALQSDLLILDE